MKQIKRITLISVLLITALLQSQTKTFNSQVRIKQVPLSSSLDSLVTINSSGLLTYLPKSELESIGGALEFITEGGNTGIAIKGRDPLNYGDIGEGAVDLSYNNTASTTRGAVGDYSFVSGRNNTAGDYSDVSGIGNVAGDYSSVSGTNNNVGSYSSSSGRNNNVGDYSNAFGYGNFAPSYGETTIGVFGTNYTPNSTTGYDANDRLFSLTNGIDGNNRNLALVVFKSGDAILDGELTADRFIKTGGTSNDVLLADGTTTPLSGIGGLALGETSSTAYRGDRGKTAYDHSQTTSGNPHNVTASDVNLGNVDNTSDANKPISTLTQSALNGKANNTTGVFSTSVEAPLFKVGLWEFKIVSNHLELHYNGAVKYRFNTTGIVEATDHKNGL